MPGLSAVNYDGMNTFYEWGEGTFEEQSASTSCECTSGAVNKCSSEGSEQNMCIHVNP